ncbi:MAG: hypothetical protein KGL35_23335 [Bradyrhizobium sp.]|uniref:hypothetical protein n=1 Tax=Bradyrhizobium sp. TaxID=376 RepID=UPI001ED79734|nr:hypothetical protein [Bradyrhizobium sp.]MBU6457235.1 hypothetical protein [Bradyrhizobium sp.]MDE2068579.1 hypothetical protein [Bradyrhizobium sp.]MDE2471581.1 hypothetical protein [Bradyrhizobium sp.]
MHPISIKAVLVSNAVQLGMALAILLIAILATLTFTWGLAGFPADVKPIADELGEAPLFALAMGAVSVLPSSLTSGYVASRLAGDRLILHGALSSGIWIFLLICIGFGGTPSDRSPHGNPDVVSPMLVLVVFFGPPLFGALGGFIGRYRPWSQQQVATVHSRYSKWWWLGYFGVQSWTAEERRARIVMGMILLVSFVAAMLVVSTVVDWLDVEAHREAFISAALSFIFGLYAARPIATGLYRDLVQRADERAQQRLSATTGEVR